MSGTKRKQAWLGRLFLMLLVMASARAWAVQATLVGDAHVSSARPTVNSGSLSNLNVGGGYTTLVQFDLGVLPAGTTASQITRATLRLYANRIDTAGTLQVAEIAGAWSESAVTYATLPAMGATLGPIDVEVADQFVTLDVTQAVQAWVGGLVTNNGFALTANSAVVQFDSKENDQTAHAPVLEIALAAGGVGTIGATGATGATGPEGPPGPQGPQGVQGSVGPAGPTGVMGATGPMGATGAVGPAGPTGATGPTGAPGAKGDQGAQGIAGQAGSQGIPGATGATGPQGPIGPVGAVGPVGLSFQGPYLSTTNYSLGDGVIWQGAAWVSLISSNHGNTPDQSPAAWSMFAAAGPTGATGATGPAGPAGPAGRNGMDGAPGATGATGLTGAAGAPGLVYEGAYAATTNYALGDVVVWQGESWASLVAANHGNTPNVSPAYWGLLTSAGPAGPTGATGATGPQGVQGAIGPAGSAGPQGPQGVAGPQGPAGAQGLTGAAGPVGAKGDQGPQGIAGQAGAQGIPGVTGATGAQGPAGAMGPAGPVGMSFQGPYNSATNYTLGDGVLWQGAGWVSLVAANHGNTPDQSPAQWAMFSAPGATGPAGPQGIAGAPGAVGAQGPTGATGPQGPAGPTGATGAQGVAGPQGATGSTGAPGINFRSGWNGGTYYSTNDAVTWNGATWLALAANINAQPDGSPQSWIVLAAAGGAGPTGAAGTAATVQIGTVTTLSAGSTATVTNSGTANVAVLNFGVPQGAQGAAGMGSGTATASGSFVAIYHGVDYTQNYFSVNQPTGSANESSAVLAWVPQSCTATRLDVRSLQAGNITVTLRMGSSPTSMSGTTLACSPSSGTCSALATLSVPAGSFLDYVITGASGTTAGVWTALTCQ